jgi:predicted dehydrogenase
MRPMSDRVKWGVIGSGGIARRRTIPEGLAVAPNAALVAVYGVSQTTNREVAQEFGALAARSIEELLTSDLDCVYIATPVHLHHQQALACLRAGKHVLCEKPLGLSVEEAEDMVHCAKSTGLQLGTAFMMRFHSQHQSALKLIAEGKLGKPVYGRAQLSCWYPPLEGAWRQRQAQGGGGSLMDMGGHCIDLLEMFFGPVERVSCFVNRSVHEYEAEDSAVVMLSFQTGALATVDTFFCIPDSSSQNVLELFGSRGSILARGTIGQSAGGTMTAFLEGDAGAYQPQQSRVENGGLELAPSPVNMYQAEIAEFSRGILGGRPSLLTGEAGLHSQKVLAACYESAKTGRAIHC